MIGSKPFNFVARLAVFCMMLSLSQQGRAQERSDPLPKIRIVLVGDSTVTPTAGWGNGFIASLSDRAQVTNLSKGGRSSMSFIKEGLWKTALALKPDFVLIQFGHNDQKLEDPTRGTDPQTTYRKYMTQYIDDARAAGIKPILVTSVSRRQWGEDGKIHSTLQPYVDVVKEIAQEKDVPLIDLHARSIELYEKLGKAEIDTMEPSKPATAPSDDPTEKQKTVLDGTHFNAKGSAVVGRIVADEMGNAVPDLAPYVLSHSTTLAASKAITVAGDGRGDVKTVKDAIALVADNSSERTVIHIKPGTYDDGQIIVPKTKQKVTFEGDGVDKTFLNFGYNTNDQNPPGVERQFWGIGVLVLGDGFEAHDLTFQNTSGDHGQALALRIDADRAIVHNCHLVGWQDTLMLNNGRDYFYDDYIAGRVDFIYGSATAVFDHCEIHSRNGGHVTAANTPQDKPYGLVFLDCKLTGDTIAWDPATTDPATTRKAKVTPLADLGRPWRPYASVTYIRCEMGDHIKPAGWNNWGKESNQETARYSEYQSTGPGANPDKRAAWSHQLTAEQAEAFTVANILGGKDQWNPTAQIPSTQK